MGETEFMKRKIHKIYFSVIIVLIVCLFSVHVSRIIIVCRSKIHQFTKHLTTESTFIVYKQTKKMYNNFKRERERMREYFQEERKKLVQVHDIWLLLFTIWVA